MSKEKVSSKETRRNRGYREALGLTSKKKVRQTPKRSMDSVYATQAREREGGREEGRKGGREGRRAHGACSSPCCRSSVILSFRFGHCNN